MQNASQVLQNMWSFLVACWNNGSQYVVPILLVCLLVALAAHIYRSWNPRMDAGGRFLELPHEVAVGTTAPGRQWRYFFRDLGLLLLVVGGIWFFAGGGLVVNQPVTAAPSPSGLSIAGGSMNTAEPTSEEVDAALQDVAAVVRRGERSVKAGKIATGTNPFFIRVPWNRVDGGKRTTFKDTLTSALENDFPGSTVTITDDDIQSVTVFRSTVEPGLGASIYCKVKLTPKNPPAGAASTSKEEEGNMPFSLGFSRRDTLEWARDIIAKEEAHIAANRIGGGSGGGGLDLLPDLPTVRAFQSSK